MLALLDTLNFDQHIRFFSEHFNEFSCLSLVRYSTLTTSHFREIYMNLFSIGTMYVLTMSYFHIAIRSLDNTIPLPMVEVQ